MIFSRQRLGYIYGFQIQIHLWVSDSDTLWVSAVQGHEPPRASPARNDADPRGCGCLGTPRRQRQGLYPLNPLILYKIASRAAMAEAHRAWKGFLLQPARWAPGGARNSSSRALRRTPAPSELLSQEPSAAVLQLEQTPPGRPSESHGTPRAPP